MDDLDQRIAAALQANGRATWHQVARVVGTSESTVARRAQRLIDRGLIRITGLADPMRCGLGYPVIMQLRCEAGATSETARLLAERSDVRFMALVTGKFDIVMEVIVPSRRYLATLLLDEIQRTPGVRRTTTESVLRNFKTTYDWSRSLLGEAGEQLRSCEPQAVPPEPVPLDRIDLEILGALAEDGRRSFADLAVRLHLSESMARRRVDALISKGCVRFATLVESQVLGFDVELLVWLRVDLDKVEATSQALSARPEVRYLSATSGFSDLMAEIILRSPDDLYDFSTHVLGSLEGIRQVEMGLELETLKRAYLRLDKLELQDEEARSPTASR